MEQVRIFSTGPVNFKIYAGWPACRPVSERPGRPFTEGFCSMHVIKSFQNWGGMNKVLKFEKKNAKKFLRFWHK